MTLPDLIEQAYGVMDYHIFGVPDWADGPRGEHYDIEAKSAAIPTEPQLQQMIRNLLADRFQLKLHLEKRPLDGYALVVQGRIQDASDARRRADPDLRHSPCHST